MAAVNEEVRRRLPVRWWLLALGALPIVGTGLLAGRLIWEQTVWTWERGPQMVGFSLAHGDGVVLLFAPIFLMLWAAIALVLMVVNLVTKRKVDTPTYVAFGLALVLFGLLAVPGGVWERLFIRRMASSAHAGDLLISAVYGKDSRTVKALLSHGVSIGATDHAYHKTALHAAAGAGDLPEVQFLVLNGADVNALDRAGDSPAALAVSGGHQECVVFLQEHGGKEIRGDEAQHQKAIYDQVQDAVEDENKHFPAQ